MDEYFSGSINGPVYFLPKLVKKRNENIGVTDFESRSRACESIVRSLRTDTMMWFKAHEVYGNLVGSRVHRTKRASRMFFEALKEVIRVRAKLADESLFTSPAPVTDYILATGGHRDAYGNQVTKYTINWPGIGGNMNARLLIEIRSVLETTNITGKFKRWVRSKFPRLVNPLKARLDTAFDTKVRVWFDPCHFYEFSLYKTHLHKVVIRPTIVNHEKERLEYDHRVFFFRYGPGGKDQ